MADYYELTGEAPGFSPDVLRDHFLTNARMLDDSCPPDLETVARLHPEGENRFTVVIGDIEEVTPAEAPDGSGEKAFARIHFKEHTREAAIVVTIATLLGAVVTYRRRTK